MKLISWNVRGELGATAEAQLTEVLKLDPDVVALQEVVRKSLPLWTDGLLPGGYTVVSSVDLLAVPGPPHGTKPRRIQRKYFNLIAVRGPLALLPGLTFVKAEERERASPEKYLAARVAVDGIWIDVHNAHLPPGSTRGVVKVHAFEAIRRRVDEPTDAARVLCGDFNTPWSEDDDRLETAAHRHPREVRERWDAAERGILEHPELRDVYRGQHQAGTPFASSHYTGRGDRRVGRRYDHVYVSPEFDTLRCEAEYLHPLLERGLSDHAPVLAALELS